MSSKNVIEMAWQQSFAPRDRRPVYEWANDYVWLSPPITRTGWFDLSVSRHFTEIFDALQNDHRREVNVLKPVRGGGSLIGDVFVLWAMANDPGPYMELFQTDKVAAEHAESRLMPNFRQCQPIRDLLPADRHKLRDQQILFSNGHAWYVSGPSIGNLQTKGVRYLRLEEVWMWDQGKMAEAEGRIGDYLRGHTSKILRISQGGPKDGVEMEQSDWYRAYYRGVQHEWEVPCLACGKYFDPIFSGQRADGSFWGMTWNRHQLPNGDWDIGRCVPTLRFECPHCANAMLDGPKTKGEWNRQGRYRIVKPDDAAGNHKRDSFRWEAVVDYPWDELVELWLEACNAEHRGDLKPKLQFYQKRRAMFKDEQSLLKSGLHLKRAAYEINSDWPEEKGRAMTIDRQDEDTYWWTVRAWSADKSRRLGFGRAFGAAALEEIRDKFKVTPNHTFCDSGFLPKGDQGVYASCLKYGWIAVKGDKAFNFTHRQKGGKLVQKSYAPLAWGDPGAGTATGNRRYAPLIRFSKFQMCSTLERLMAQAVWDEPATSEDAELEKEYAAQMSARVRKTEYNAKTGESRVYYWEGKNDHASDCANMQVLYAILEELLPDPASEKLTKSENKEDEQQT
jgi:hypothetical protein